MKGFNVLERTKLKMAFKMCNDHQFEIIKSLVNEENERRKKKAIKNAKSRKSTN